VNKRYENTIIFSQKITSQGGGGGGIAQIVGKIQRGEGALPNLPNSKYSTGLEHGTLLVNIGYLKKRYNDNRQN